MRDNLSKDNLCVEDTSEDVVNNPKHYKLYNHECIDEMVLVFGIEDVKAFCRCNIWKYRYRASAKNGEEDLRKAEWYMNKLEELNKQIDVFDEVKE